MTKSSALMLVLMAACSRAAGAQTTVSAGYEVHRDRFHYTFENPSSIDTDFLVPHAFTQTYDGDNHWIVGSVRFPFAGEHMEAGFGITPERQTRGWDLDTFYNPNNDVAVSGTKGDVLMRSVRFRYWSEGKVKGWPMRIGYALRRDRSRFLPTDRILTHTNPPSDTRSPTFGRETTYSLVHEVPLETWRVRPLSPSWIIVGRVDVSPLIWARLTTLLPDKYPGRRIIFDAKAFGAGAGVEFVRKSGTTLLTIAIRYGRTGSYSSAKQFSRSALTVSAAVGRTL